MDHNTTRMLIMAREQVLPPVNNGPVITTMIFSLRSVPAALYKALGGFATNGINLTKLESYMVGGHFSAAQFYIDAEVHQDSDAFRYAIEELEFFTHPGSIRILGPILLIRHSARLDQACNAPNHAGRACAFGFNIPYMGKEGWMDDRFV